jgi:hypothetical protein
MSLIEKEVSAEVAHFIILSLYREYSKLFLAQDKASPEREYYKKQMGIIKKDLFEEDKGQIVYKAINIYAPLLKKMENGEENTHG